MDVLFRCVCIKDRRLGCLRASLTKPQLMGLTSVANVILECEWLGLIPELILLMSFISHLEASCC